MLRLRVAQVADLWSARPAKRLDPAPSLVASHMPLAESQVERGLQHAEDAVGSRPALTHRIGILAINVADVPLLRRLARAQTGRRLGERAVPLPDQCRRQGVHFESAELWPNEGVDGDLKAVECLAAAARVVGDVVVQATIDGIGSGFRLGVERSEPLARLGLRLAVVEDAFAIGVERVIGGAEPTFTAVTGVRIPLGTP